MSLEDKWPSLNMRSPETPDDLMRRLEASAGVGSVTISGQVNTKKDTRFGVDKDAPAQKFDEDKARFELIPPESLFALAMVLSFGAKKYAARNWEKGMSWGRVFGATMRHLWAWWGGKAPTNTNFVLGELDVDTGYSHLWHAMFGVAVLIAYEERKIGEDDRYGAPGQVGEDPQ